MGTYGREVWGGESGARGAGVWKVREGVRFWVVREGAGEVDLRGREMYSRAGGGGGLGGGGKEEERGEWCGRGFG